MLPTISVISAFFSLIIELVDARAPYLRDRPRGLGLLQLPTGMADVRSGPFLPGLYIAGNKINEKPQTVPDVHLPGQPAEFTGKSAFNPFTHMVSAVYAEDLSDGWGAGMAVNGVNGHGLNVRKNFDAYADVPLNLNDGMYQPFISAFTVGGEYDLRKIQEVSGSLDLPIPGINELFDFNGRIMNKNTLITNSVMEFPLTLSDPNERAPYTFRITMKVGQKFIDKLIINFQLWLFDSGSLVLNDSRASLDVRFNSDTSVICSVGQFETIRTAFIRLEAARVQFLQVKYAVWASDRHMAYGHVAPNVNLFVIGKDKIMERLTQNRLNPTLIG